MSTEVPFKISIPDTQLELLRKKLDLVTFPDELEDAGSRYGVPLADIKRLVARWKDGFDWRVEEAKLNEEMPQFTRDIEVSDGHGTLNVHYVHKRSEVDGAIPLLFVHGWPGSFIESRKILPLLTESSRDGDFPSFHVVALSLPGFGFSEAPKKSGFTPDYHAEVGHKLMLSLGYNEYVTQGGDWGYVITRKIAMKYGGTHSKAWHTNMSMGFPPLNPLSHPILFLQWMLTPYSEPEKAGFTRWKQFQKEENGYYILQCNKPQTVGYALADSPVGLLGWIYEGLVNWTDEYPWTDDEVLTWISIYLFSRAGPTASFRIYYEAQHSKDSGFISLTGGNPKIPMGVSRFPKDMVVAPMSWIKTTGNLVFAGDHTSVGTNKGGGHFAAYERPEALVEDLRNMFRRGGPAFGVTSKKGGYFDK